jgi:hypothetical protein
LSTCVRLLRKHSPLYLWCGPIIWSGAQDRSMSVNHSTNAWKNRYVCGGRSRNICSMSRQSSLYKSLLVILGSRLVSSILQQGASHCLSRDSRTFSTAQGARSPKVTPRSDHSTIHRENKLYSSCTQPLLWLTTISVVMSHIGYHTGMIYTGVIPVSVSAASILSVV